MSRSDRLLETALDCCLGRLGEAALFVAVIENAGAILVAAVAELAILRERIIIIPEHVEQPLVAHLRRLIDDFDRLRVAGAAG